MITNDIFICISMDIQVTGPIAPALITILESSTGEITFNTIGEPIKVKQR